MALVESLRQGKMASSLSFSYSHPDPPFSGLIYICHRVPLGFCPEFFQVPILSVVNTNLRSSIFGNSRQRFFLLLFLLLQTKLFFSTNCFQDSSIGLQSPAELLLTETETETETETQERLSDLLTK